MNMTINDEVKLGDKKLFELIANNQRLKQIRR